MAGDLCGFGNLFSFRGSEDPIARAQRKLVIGAFGASAMPVYRRMQEEEATKLALECIRDSSILRDNIQLCV